MVCIIIIFNPHKWNNCIIVYMHAQIFLSHSSGGNSGGYVTKQLLTMEGNRGCFSLVPPRPILLILEEVQFLQRCMSVSSQRNLQLEQQVGPAGLLFIRATRNFGLAQQLFQRFIYHITHTQLVKHFMMPDGKNAAYCLHASFRLWHVWQVIHTVMQVLFNCIYST